MRLFQTISSFIALAFLLSSCGENKKPNTSVIEDPDKVDLTSLEVPRDFDWSASNILDLSVNLQRIDKAEFDIEGQIIHLLDQNGQTVARSTIEADRANFSLQLPVYIKDLFLYYPPTENVLQLSALDSPLDVDMALAYWAYDEDNGLDYLFELAEAAADEPAGKIVQEANLVRSGDFAGLNLTNSAPSQLKPASLYKASVEQQGIWYSTPLSERAWLPATDAGYLAVGHLDMAKEYSYVYQDLVEINADNKPASLTLTADVIVPDAANVKKVKADIGLVALLPDGKFRIFERFKVRGTDKKRDFTDWNSISLTAKVPNKALGIRVLITAHSKSTRIHVDNISVNGTLLRDSDGDGVNDGEDDFPNDAAQSVKNRVPYEGFIVNAFEDLWPYQGDYDFNDLVIAHSVEFGANRQQKLTSATVTLKINAIGAGLHNGLAYRVMELKQKKRSEINRNIVSGVNGEAHGLHPTANNTVIVTQDIFDTLYDFYQNNGIGPTRDPHTVEFTLSFAENVNLKSQKLAGEFFLFRSDDLSHEIHQSNLPPTSAADRSKFGTLFDRSKSKNNVWYKTQNGMPWGIEIITGATPFKHPLERTSIQKAYPAFASWAVSGGKRDADWFLYPVDSAVFDISY